MLVGSMGMGLSLVWPEDPQCRTVGVLCGLGSLWALVGSAVRLQTHVWPKDPRCRYVVELRSFEGACGLQSVGVVPCMDQGLTV